jgi:zinc/manganese transport system substrate-binding protein
MKMQKKSFIFILFFVIVAFYGKNIKAGDLNVITTLPSLGSITQYIGGDFIDVYSITRGVQDAHYVEAKPSYMMKLNKADLLIYSGLELEIGWLPLLIQGARNNEVTVGGKGNLNASLAVSINGILEKPRGEVDRSMGDVHPSGNPHYLLNPNNAIEVAELIRNKLCELDPENKIHYRKNSDDFNNILQNKIKALEKQIERLEGKQVVCYHIHWSYLLDWLGIKSIGYIELRPGIPPTPKHKREIIELMEEKQIKVVIISSWKEPTKAEEVAKASGAKLVILPGEVKAMDGAEDYLNWIEYLVTHLDDAFLADTQNTRSRNQIRQHERKRGIK